MTETKYAFKLDDEIANLIQSTLPKNVSLGIAAKVCLMGWAASNLNEKQLFEAIGRMQFRQHLKKTIRYLKDKNLKLRIEAIENILKEHENL